MSNSFISISFLGDISLNGQYEKMYLQGKKPFDTISLVLKGKIVVGNLECLSRGKQGVNKLKIPRLETSIETLNYLKDLNLKVACLANNHVFDNLEDGFDKTIDFLIRNKIRYTGASLNKDNFKQPIIINENGIKIGILNYVTKDTNPNPPKGTKIKLNWFKLENVIKDITNIKTKVNHVVVNLHWGGRIEGGLFPDWEQPQIARRLIDAGADLIIGHHSHTIQPFEIYKGKYIFYSLGNFCFANIYNNGELYSRLSPRQKKGLILNVEFGHKTYNVSQQYTYNDNGFIRIFNKPYTLRLNQKVLFPIIKKRYSLWKIYFFNIRKITPIFNYFFVQKNSLCKALNLKKIMKYFYK